MKHSILILALLIASTFLAGCSGEESKAETTTTATSTAALPPELQEISEAMSSTAPVDAAAAESVPANQFAATGEFVSPVRSELAPKSPGRVGALHVDEGARIRRGQPLLTLETDYLKLNLQAADAQVAQAKAAHDEAARDLERKKELIAKGSIPRATFDRSQAAFDQTAAALAAAQAQAALLRQQLADAVLRSPVDGIVAEKRTDVGARLGDGGVAFVVLQLSPLRLRFQVPERYLGQIERGDAVVARVDPYPNETFEGTIKTVGGVIDPRTRTMFAEAEFPNRDGRLRPGLFARVEVRLD
jgi:membrane fusion protein (multidrug efflux system)